MTALSVTLPDRLEVSRTRSVIDCAHALVHPGDVVVDASRIIFAQPFGIVTLGAALLRREAAGLARPAYVPPTDAAASAFLHEVGFDELVRTGQTTGAGTLAIRRLSATTLEPAYSHSVAGLLEQLVPDTSESVAYLVETALNEMLQNAVEHAASITDAVVLTRWYRAEENVRIAIADSGRGFAESLRRNPGNAGVPDDATLVRRAVTVEGTTGRTAQRFGGLGLKNLYGVCTQRGGSVHVTSHVVDAHYTASNNRETYVPRLDGSTVEIDFRPGPDAGSRAEHKRETRRDEDFF